MSRERLRAVLVGTGSIAQRHAAVLQGFSPAVELAAVVSRRAGSAAALTEAYGGVGYATLSQALATTAADLVVVCTPTGLHGDAVRAALAAGAHVLVEKPAETSLERLDALLTAQTEAGRQVAVVSQHRFDPATTQVLEAIDAGRLGRITSGVASIGWWRSQAYYDAADWRGTRALDGGGALTNQGIHTVDLLLEAMGPAVEVFAYTGTLAHRRIEVEDVAAAVVRFRSGAVATLHASTAAYPGLGTRLQVHGDRGTAVIEDDALTVLHSTDPGTEPAELPFGGPAARADTPAPAGDASLRAQYADLLAAIEEHRPVRVGLGEHRRALALIDGAYRSAASGRPVALVG